MISISGISVLDNSATSPTPASIVSFSSRSTKRVKAKGQDLLSLLTAAAEEARVAARRAGFRAVPPPIQGIGNAGGFQMQLELLGGSFDYQSSTS